MISAESPHKYKPVQAVPAVQIEHLGEEGLVPKDLPVAADRTTIRAEPVMRERTTRPRTEIRLYRWLAKSGVYISLGQK